MAEQSRARIENELLAGIRQLLHGNQVQSFFVLGRNQKALDYELAAILKLPRRVRNIRPRELRPVRVFQQLFFRKKFQSAKELITVVPQSFLFGTLEFLTKEELLKDAHRAEFTRPD